MLISEGGEDAWNGLNVKPVSISYEWDPCDAMKVRELLFIEKNGTYDKSPGEDEMSMAIGMTGWKGRVHLEFCNTIPWKQVEGERTERTIAELVDNAIFKGYKIWPNQVLAAEYIGDTELLNYSQDIEITENDRLEFKERLAKVVTFVGANIATQFEIERTWCNMMVQTLKAKYRQSS